MITADKSEAHTVQMIKEQILRRDHRTQTKPAGERRGEGKREPQERRYYDTVHSRSSNTTQPI